MKGSRIVWEGEDYSRGVEPVERALWAAEEHDRLYGREAERQAREDSENYFLWCSWEEMALWSGSYTV